MANYKGHIVGGISASLIYALIIYFTPLRQYLEASNFLDGWQYLCAIVIIGILFGLFPDVDTNSKAQDLFFGIVFPLNILLIITNNLQVSAYLGLIAMLPIIGHHRGWTHAKWAMFVVPLPILVVPYLYNQDLLSLALVYYGASVAGYFSHLFLDGQIFKFIRIKN